MLQLHGPGSADAGLHALGLTTMAAVMLAGARTGGNGCYGLAGVFWQSVFGRFAGYEDMNGAERLRHDAAMRWTRGFHTLEQEFLELNFIISEYLLRSF